MYPAIELYVFSIRQTAVRHASNHINYLSRLTSNGPTQLVTRNTMHILYLRQIPLQSSRVSFQSPVVRHVMVLDTFLSGNKKPGLHLYVTTLLYVATTESAVAFPTPWMGEQVVTVIERQTNL